MCGPSPSGANSGTFLLIATVALFKEGSIAHLNISSHSKKLLISNIICPENLN